MEIAHYRLDVNFKPYDLTVITSYSIHYTKLYDVESVSDPSYSLLGVSIQTTGATVFRDFDGSTLTSFEFFT